MIAEVTEASVRASDAKPRSRAAPTTANHIRAVVSSIFGRAFEAGGWTGANPTKLVRKRPVAVSVYDWLPAAGRRAGAPPRLGRP
jgi:hypothetical protein